MLLPTLRSAPVENSANAENISASVISATRCERRFRTFFFLKKVNRRKRFRNPAHRSKFKLYRPLGYIIIPKILTHIQQSNQIRMHFPAGIIPPRAFLQFRINFSDGNHPCKSFSAYQDAFPRRDSSLQELFRKSGSIFPAGIIPTRLFLQFRINFPAGNHPYKTFPANQDQFSRRESSLQELFCNSGCISPTEIIPARAFLQFRINFPGGNHPCEKNHVNRDEFPSRKSSLQNISGNSGCYDSFQMPQAIPTFPPARRKSFILLCREVSSRRFSSSADFCCPAASLYTHSR